MAKKSTSRLGSSTDGPQAGGETIIPLCLSEAERIECQKAAERSGLSLSAWIRDRLNEALKREAKEA